MVALHSRSSSISSELADTMQLFIKPISGDTITLAVPTTITAANLATLVSIRTRQPTSTLRLNYAGHLINSPSTPLADLGVRSESIISLSAPLRGGMPPRKLRCSAQDCREPVQKIVGDCGFCGGCFCGKHRLLEDHRCGGLESCKKESYERNAAQLNSERTIAIKGV